MSAIFWMRRIRRLLPPILVLLCLISVYAVFAADPWQLRSIRFEGFATLFYVQNWYLIFGHPVGANLGHTWSLSIEEQWYFVWPVLLAALLFVVGGSRRRVAGVVAALAVASFAWMWHLADVGQFKRATIGTDARASELLVGAALAVLLLGFQVRNRAARTALEISGLLGLGVLLWMACTFTNMDTRLFHGGSVLVAVVAAIVIAASVQPASPVLRRALSWRPLVALGLVSYGVYLYHIPLLAWISPENVNLSGGPLLALRVGAILAISWLSYVLVERPLRRVPATARMTIRYIPAAAAVVVVVLIATAGARPKTPADSFAPFARGVSDTTPAGSRRVLVVGDGGVHELATTGGVYDAADFRGFPVGLMYCDFFAGALVAGASTGKRTPCSDWKGIFRVAREEFDAPASVVMVGSQAVFDRQVGGTTLRVGTRALGTVLRARLDEVRRVLTATGSHMVLLSLPCPIPIPTEPAAFASVRLDPNRRSWVNSIWREFAADHPRTVSFADVNEVLCPGGNARPVIAGQALRGPDGRLSPAGVRVVWDWLDRVARSTTGARV